MLKRDELPVISQQLRRGNAWELQFRLRASANGALTVPTGIVRLQLREKRGLTEAVVKTFSTADSTITVNTATGLVTIGPWAASETKDVTAKSLLGEVVNGEDDEHLMALFGINLTLLDALTVGETI